MMINSSSVDRERLKTFIRNLGLASERISLREKIKGVEKKEQKSKQREEEGLKKPELRKRGKIEKKEEIKKLKESINRIETLFKKIQKKKHDKTAAKRIKFRLDLLTRRLKELEKKK